MKQNRFASLFDWVLGIKSFKYWYQNVASLNNLNRWKVSVTEAIRNTKEENVHRFFNFQYHEMFSVLCTLFLFCPSASVAAPIFVKKNQYSIHMNNPFFGLYFSHHSCLEDSCNHFCFRKRLLLFAQMVNFSIEKGKSSKNHHTECSFNTYVILRLIFFRIALNDVPVSWLLWDENFVCKKTRSPW